MRYDHFSEYLMKTAPLNIVRRGNSCQLAAGEILKRDLDLEARVIRDCKTGKYDRDSDTYDNLHSKIKSEIPSVNTASVSGFLRRQLYSLYEGYLIYKAREKEISGMSASSESAAQNSNP